MDYGKLSEDAAELAASSNNVEDRFYARGLRDAYATVARLGTEATQWNSSPRT